MESGEWRVEPFAKFGCTWPAMGFPLGARASRILVRRCPGASRQVNRPTLEPIATTLPSLVRAGARAGITTLPGNKSHLLANAKGSVESDLIHA